MVESFHKDITAGIVRGVVDEFNVQSSAMNNKFTIEFGAIINTKVVRCTKNCNDTVFKKSAVEEEEQLGR